MLELMATDLGAGLYQGLVGRLLPSAAPQEPGELPTPEPERVEANRG